MQVHKCIHTCTRPPTTHAHRPTGYVHTGSTSGPHACETSKYKRMSIHACKHTHIQMRNERTNNCAETKPRVPAHNMRAQVNMCIRAHSIHTFSTHKRRHHLNFFFILLKLGQQSGEFFMAWNDDERITSSLPYFCLQRFLRACKKRPGRQELEQEEQIMGWIASYNLFFFTPTISQSMPRKL